MPEIERARPEWGALEAVHELADARVVLVSSQSDWASVAATRFRMRRTEVTLPPLGVPAFGVNYGQHMKLERTLNGRTVGARAVAGHLSLLPPDAATRWMFDKPGDVAVVFLNGRLFRRAVEECAGRDPRSIEIAPRFAIRDLVLERIAHRLLQEISDPGAASRLVAEELAQELAAHLLLAHSNLDPRRAQRSHPIAPHRLKRAQEFVVANLKRELSLADIAGAAGMSLFHFAKSFKQATGQTPHRYLTAQRLLHARALLHDVSLPIGEIARSVGLSHSHFTVVFTRELEMTPTKFREVLLS
jgi:AraC family transcriptional regulator